MTLVVQSASGTISSCFWAKLILFKADPSGYQEISRTQVCGKNWCHPAYADGKIVVRDAKKLTCIDLRPAS